MQRERDEAGVIWDEVFRIARAEKGGSRKQKEEITWIHENWDGLNKKKAIEVNNDFK